MGTLNPAHSLTHSLTNSVCATITTATAAGYVKQALEEHVAYSSESWEIEW